MALAKRLTAAFEHNLKRVRYGLIPAFTISSIQSILTACEGLVPEFDEVEMPRNFASARLSRLMNAAGTRTHFNSLTETMKESM